MVGGRHGLPAAIVHGGDQWPIRRAHAGARLAPQEVLVGQVGRNTEMTRHASLGSP